MISLLLLLLGLIAGSFLNAVIYRLSQNQSALRGRSYCPRCKHALGFWDLVPVVSFIALSGRCRYCKQPISWQYPLVELATALCFVWLYARLSQQFAEPRELYVRLAVYAIIACFLIVIFAYDALHYLILDSVALPAIVIALLANLYLGVPLAGMALAAGVGAGFFAIQYILSRGAWIGGGDIRLGALMGVILAWPHVLVALFLAYFIGSIIGIGLLISGAKRMQSKIPFGTFLALATFVTMLYGQDMLAWYLSFYL